MDSPETTRPMGIGCIALRRVALSRDCAGIPAGTAVADLMSTVVPYLEPIPGRELPEHEPLELLRNEILRAYACLVARKGPRPPSAWTQMPEAWFLHLDVSIPAANAERVRLFGAALWGLPEGEEIVPQLSTCGLTEPR